MFFLFPSGFPHWTKAAKQLTEAVSSTQTVALAMGHNDLSQSLENLDAEQILKGRFCWAPSWEKLPDKYVYLSYTITNIFRGYGCVHFCHEDLVSCGNRIFYWEEDRSSEISSFVLQRSLIPVLVLCCVKTIYSMYTRVCVKIFIIDSI